MGNLCPIFGNGQSAGATERSSLLANQPPAPVRQQQHQHTVQLPSRQRDPSEHAYTIRSVSNRNSRSRDDTNMNFDKIGLENLDKRLSNIAALFNNLLERYSNLKTGLVQLDQIAKELCAKSDAPAVVAAAAEDPIRSAFAYFAREMAKTATTDNPLTVKLKQQAKNWTEAVFDSRSLQYDQISFLNLYNLLGKYAWELRSKTPPLRGTVAMTTQEEETFRRDLLVASLNSEANAFGSNFSKLRRADEQLGDFERLGDKAGERLTAAAQRLMEQ